LGLLIQALTTPVAMLADARSFLVGSLWLLPLPLPGYARWSR
jgi:hypothetical protein